MYTRRPCDHPIIILVFQNVDTPKYQCGTIQNLSAPSKSRRHPPSTFLFLLNQQCQKPDEETSVSRPNIPVKPGSAFPQQSERNRYLCVRFRSYKSQTPERAPQPPEATAPPRSMSGVIGPHFWTVNEVFREKSFLCYVIENAKKKLNFGVRSPFSGPFFRGNHRIFLTNR